MAMSDNVTVAIVTGSAAALVGIAGLLANVIWLGRSFNLLKEGLNQHLTSSLETVNQRLTSGLDMVNLRIDGLAQRITEVERRLGIIEADIKEWDKIHRTDIARLKEKTGLQ
jgi:hypothetical protein